MYMINEPFKISNENRYVEVIVTVFMMIQAYYVCI